MSKDTSDTSKTVRKNTLLIPALYRGMGVALILMALGWGVVTGISLSTGAIVSPIVAIYGALAILVYAAVYYIGGSPRGMTVRSKSEVKSDK